MEVKLKKAARIACDLIAISYLRENRFDDLAAEHQAHQHISDSLVTSFKSLTLERLVKFNEKTVPFRGNEKQEKSKPSNQNESQKYQTSESILTRAKIEPVEASDRGHKRKQSNYDSDDPKAKHKRKSDLEKNQHSQVSQRTKKSSPIQVGFIETNQTRSNSSQISDQSTRQTGKCETIQGPKLNQNQRSSKLFSETHGLVKEPSTKGPQTPRPKELSPSSQKLCDHLVLNYLKRNGFEDILNEFKDSRIIGEVRDDITLEKLVEFCEKNLDRSYDSWTTIREGYSDLYGQLNENNTESEVDKVVKYILDVNIPVRYLNVKLNISSLFRLSRKDVKNHLKQNCPGFLYGHFSIGKDGEDGMILQNWKKLVNKAQVKDPDKLILDFIKIVRGSVLQKRNVLGCYLAQDLPYIRHCIDVFTRATIIVPQWNDGKFTEADDKLILSEVEKSGPISETWKRLAKLLNRSEYSAIQKHFTLLESEIKGRHLGKWTQSDYESFFSFLFDKDTIGNLSNFDYINSIPTKVLSEAAEKIQRCPHNVFIIWNQQIKPVLLSYHNGILHQDWKRKFLKYLANKKFNSVKEIDWYEVKILFPCHSISSLSKAFQHFPKSSKENNFYLAIEEYLQKSKHSSARKDFSKYREDVVAAYDKARGFTESNDRKTAASTPDETSLPTL